MIHNNRQEQEAVMRNILKNIKILSLLLCCGMFLCATTSTAYAESFDEKKIMEEYKQDQEWWNQEQKRKQAEEAKKNAAENAKKRDEWNKKTDAAKLEEGKEAFRSQYVKDEESAKAYDENQANQKQRAQYMEDHAKANQEYNAGSMKRSSELKKEEKKVETAQKELDAAKAELSKADTPEKMAAANKKLKAAKENLENQEEEYKKAKKSAKKADKAARKDKKKADKEIAKQEKELRKAEKKQRKAIEKAQDDAQDDLKKANKKISKLEKKCAKGKCDDEDLKELAEWKAKSSQAQAALQDANARASAFSASSEELAAQNYVDTKNAEAKAFEIGTSTNAAAEADIAQAQKDLEEAKSNAPRMCSEVEGNIFLLIACKATTTLADVREIAYIISGFGMVALAYAAIMGKMSFKHLANIGIGLFLLSMMTPFIEYFTTGQNNTLRFGKYLPAGFTDIQGSNGERTDCDEDLNKNSTFCNQILPEAIVTAKKKKWSLKDLKGSIKAGMNAVRNANDMYKSAKNTVQNVKSTVSNMKARIKSGGGGLGGIINAVGAVTSATGSIVDSSKLLANNIATNAGNLSNNIRDAGSTNAARKARAELVEERDRLAKKCSAGNCSAGDKKYLESLDGWVEDNKTGTQKWLENDGKGGGATILAGINKVDNITGKVAGGVSKAANAAHEGQAMSGGTLGTILGVGMGIGTGVTEGMDIAKEGKEKGAFDFRSGEHKRQDQAAAEEAAFKKSAGYVANTQISTDGRKVETLGNGDIRTTSKDGKTVTVVGKDGSVSTTQGGTTITKHEDGSKVVADAEGNKVTYDANGKKTKVDLKNPYKRATAESNAAALKNHTKSAPASTKGQQKPAQSPKASSSQNTGKGATSSQGKPKAKTSSANKSAATKSPEKAGSENKPKRTEYVTVLTEEEKAAAKATAQADTQKRLGKIHDIMQTPPQNPFDAFKNNGTNGFNVFNNFGASNNGKSK